MNKPTVLPADPQLYLLRVWRNTDRFRAAVRRVDSEATQWLESPQAVADWLAADDHAPPAGAAPEQRTSSELSRRPS